MSQFICWNTQKRWRYCTVFFSSNFKEHMLPLFEEFRIHSCKLSPTFAFWDMFLRAVEILLQNIRAERNRLWLLHLQMVAAMLPCVFITNRTNYARWICLKRLNLSFCQVNFQSDKNLEHQTVSVVIWLQKKTII